MERREAPFYLRRVKEALVSFPDPETGKVKMLFTKRNVRTSDWLPSCATKSAIPVNFQPQPLFVFAITDPPSARKAPSRRAGSESVSALVALLEGPEIPSASLIKPHSRNQGTTSSIKTFV